MVAWAGAAVSAGVVTGPGISALLIESNWHLRWKQYFHFLLDRFSIPFLILAFVGIITLVVALIFLKNEKHTIAFVRPKATRALFPKGKWSLFGKTAAAPSGATIGHHFFREHFPAVD